MHTNTNLKAEIAKFEGNLWYFHIKIPASKVQHLISGEDRRVVCTINNAESFQCALMPYGDGDFFINLNKKLREKLNLKLGTTVDVALAPDESDYGLPMPQEFKETLEQDENGNRLFHALTPGKQRTLLYIAGNVKNTDSRIHRAITIVEHLKNFNGKIDFKKLNEALKRKIN